MKKIIILSACLLYITTAFAQEINSRKTNLTGLVTEKFKTVIEVDKEVKQGMYQAFYNKKILIATGKYTNDKRTGTWHFYDRDKTPLQNYNYDTNILQYEAPDSTSGIKYAIDSKFTAADHVTRPVKPGGRYFGYVPYLRLFKLPDDLMDIEQRRIKVFLELLISPGGRLADYKIHVNVPSHRYENTIPVNLNLLNDTDKMFLPASMNGQPISSTIVIECFVTTKNEIDIK